MGNPLQIVRDSKALSVGKDPKLTTVYMLQSELNEHERIAADYREAEKYAASMAKAEEDIVHQLRLTITGLSA